jgi:hypothetical protein
MLKLPDKGQSFPQIRRQNLLYVDKTKYFYPIATEGGNYFLSRPRRFGKSLIVGALAELLKGNRELFKGLWIDSSDYDFKKLPVVSLSMVGSCDSKDALLDSIKTELDTAAKDNGFSLNELDIEKDSPPGNILIKLVSKLYYPERVPVAIFIDEYDAPIQKVIRDTARAEGNRDVLSSFYSSIKSLADKDKTHLVFVTGVTKFAKASIFSGFNNLSDMTLDSEYNAICGFTVEEFQSYFLDYLPGILERYKSNGFMPPEADLDYLIEEIVGYYDGYSWDGKTRVLNPYSLIQALAQKKLKAYWFSSGAPSFLMTLLKREGSGFSFPENPQMDETSLDAVDITDLELTPLLFQTGYLTVDKPLSSDSYLLRRPNKEVSEATDKSLVKYLLGQRDISIAKLRERIGKALEVYDSAALAASFQEILLWNSYRELKASEGQYHGLIFSVLNALGFSVMTEQVTPEGVFDILLTLGQRVAFVFELKYEKFTPALGQGEEDAKKIEEKLKAAIKKAKDQIQRRNYDAKYNPKYAVVKKVAVAFVGKAHVAVEIY